MIKSEAKLYAPLRMLCYEKSENLFVGKNMVDCRL